MCGVEKPGRVWDNLNLHVRKTLFIRAQNDRTGSSRSCCKSHSSSGVTETSACTTRLWTSDSRVALYEEDELPYDRTNSLSSDSLQQFKLWYIRSEPKNCIADFILIPRIGEAGPFLFCTTGSDGRAFDLLTKGCVSGDGGIFRHLVHLQQWHKYGDFSGVCAPITWMWIIQKS